MDFVERRVSPETAERVEKHIDTCETCRMLVAHMSKDSDRTFRLGSISDEPTPAVDAPAAAPQPGDVLAGRFRLGHMIGRGAMGVVFEAADEQLDVHVALKLLSPE